MTSYDYDRQVTAYIRRAEFAKANPSPKRSRRLGKAKREVRRAAWQQQATAERMAGVR